jgi:hypothetical protein
MNSSVAQAGTSVGRVISLRVLELSFTNTASTALFSAMGTVFTIFASVAGVITVARCENARQTCRKTILRQVPREIVEVPQPYQFSLWKLLNDIICARCCVSTRFAMGRLGNRAKAVETSVMEVTVKSSAE